MVAYVQNTNVIGSLAYYSTGADGESVTVMPGVKFFNTLNIAYLVSHVDFGLFNFGTILSGASTAIVMTGSDGEILNAAGATIGTTATDDQYAAIELVGNRNILRNNGDIFGSDGYAVGIGGSDTTLINSGSLYGGRGGILTFGNGSNITNSGIIESGSAASPAVIAAVTLQGSGVLFNNGTIRSPGPSSTEAVQVDLTGPVTIENTGTVYCANGAAIRTISTTASVTVVNSGLMQGAGQFTPAIVTSDQSDSITNSGRIVGTITMGGGEDIFDGIGGQVLGTVYGDLGNDLYRVSDANAQLFEYVGEGFDAVESKVDFSLNGRGEIEDLKLLGTAIEGAGNELSNIVTGNEAANRLFGNGGADDLHGGGGDDLIDGGADADNIYGGTGDDTARGRSGIDLMLGEDGEDELAGGVGNDMLNGGNDDDRLTGGAGRDLMTGGADSDTFVFKRPSETGLTNATRDIVADFQAGLDVIDLSGMDAVAGLAGNQAFAFIGTSAFSGAAGELRIAVSGSTVTIEGTVDSNAVADFQIRLSGLTALAVDDLVL